MLLEIDGLTVQRPNFTLGPIDLKLQPEEVVGILGRNGAGKTTFFDCIAGHIDGTSGTVHLKDQRMGLDFPDGKHLVGYLPQHDHLPPWATAGELLDYAARLRNISTTEVETSIKRWDCQAFLNKATSSCSHGMTKRIGLALATLHNPPCLILDEPFTGLDLGQIRALEETLQSRRESKTLTLISSHLVPYIARHCTRVFTIAQGQLSELTNWASMTELEKVDSLEKNRTIS